MVNVRGELDVVGLGGAVAGRVEALQRPGKSKCAQAGQIELDSGEFRRYRTSVALEIRHRQRLGRRPGSGASDVIENGAQRCSHHRLKVPQGLVPVEEHRLYLCSAHPMAGIK